MRENAIILIRQTESINVGSICDMIDKHSDGDCDTVFEGNTIRVPKDNFLYVNDLEQEIVSSSSKVLATYGSCGLNVVPVSVVEFTEDFKIIFFNFFMDKTVTNIIPSQYGNRGTNHAAFTYWSGNQGRQLKGNVEYINDGDFFESKREYINANYPHLSQVDLRGVIVFEVEEVFDISKPATK